jgi:hypothetical protein
MTPLRFRKPQQSLQPGQNFPRRAALVQQRLPGPRSPPPTENSPKSSEKPQGLRWNACSRSNSLWPRDWLLAIRDGDSHRGLEVSVSVASERSFLGLHVDCFQLEGFEHCPRWWKSPLRHSVDETSVNSGFSRPTALSACVGNPLAKQLDNIISSQDFLHARQLAVFAHKCEHGCRAVSKLRDKPRRRPAGPGVGLFTPEPMRQGNGTPSGRDRGAQRPKLETALSRSAVLT